MIGSIIYAVVLAGFTLWQGIDATAVLPTPSVLGIESAQATPTPSPTATSFIIQQLLATPTATPSPTPTPTPTANPTATPSTTIISENCDFEYHYDSREAKDEDGKINIEHRCQKKTNGEGSVKSNVDIDLNTSSNTSSKGNVKVDVSVKNN